MSKQNLVPKSWLIYLITSLWQLLKTSIKNYSYKCKLEGAAGKFSNQFILFKANKGMRSQLKYIGISLYQHLNKNTKNESA